MKKIVYILLSLLLCVGAIGGTVALAKHLTDKAENPVKDSTDKLTSQIKLKEGEILIDEPSDFRAGMWYRFYLDESNPESEAYMVLNLVDGDGGFSGGYKEVGQTVEIDMPKVTIGISNDFEGTGYIYWNDEIRLQVDADIGEATSMNCLEINLEENVYTGAGDNKTKPDIWFELTRRTECIELVTKGGGYIVAVDKDSENQNGNSGDTEQGNTQQGNTQTALVAPANEASLIANGLEMMAGASIAVSEDETGPQIRFSCIVDKDVKTAVDNDANKSLSFLIAPINYFDNVNPNNYTYVDWVKAFQDAGKTVIFSPLEESNFYEYGEDFMVRFRLQNVLYTNMNRDFVCMLVLSTQNGDTTTYQYSAYPEGLNYRTNARSVANVAAAALNAHTLGLETFTDAQKAILQNYINQSVDLANGMETSTDDGSKYVLTTNATTKNMSVGSTFQVVASYTPSNVKLPIWYRSNDTSVVTVDDKGLIKAVGKGTAVVGVYLAGEVVAITITVA